MHFTSHTFKLGWELPKQKRSVILLTRCRTRKYEDFSTHIVSPSRTKGILLHGGPPSEFSHHWRGRNSSIISIWCKQKRLLGIQKYELKCVVYMTRNPVTFVIQRRRDLFLLDQLARDRKHQAAYTVGGDTFRENIETLVSYNVRNDGSQQDCLYIEQGHLMTPTSFMTYSMAIDPRKSVVVTWTPVHLSSMQQGFQPSSLWGSPFYTSC